MKTPIVDFLNEYAASGTVRMHMPGHKGISLLGCEPFDITEIRGADNLYEAEGIIRESEKNASALFGTADTFYSTEGSSLAIRAMLHLAATCSPGCKKPFVLAARNVHKAFIYAAALIDLDVRFLEGADMSLCSCILTPELLDKALSECTEPPAAVYITSPDYLGRLQPVKALSEVCHRHGTHLLVDNAHGAYLAFCSPSLHPIALGADACCDSAHKTLPVLTGGAYLHFSASAPKAWREQARSALSVYGSTSPSYLIMASLDHCNALLASEFSSRLTTICSVASAVRGRLEHNGFYCLEGEPMKLTIDAVRSGVPGTVLADRLRANSIECEHADPDAVVLMFSPANTAAELDRIVTALGRNTAADPLTAFDSVPPQNDRKCTVRQAIFGKKELLPIEKCVGRICASPAVSCPPAIPIVIPGEVITPDSIPFFKRYGILSCEVLCE